MANESKRLRPTQIAEDESAFAALQAMAGYAPVNQAYTVAAITAAHEALRNARAAEAQAEAAYAAARDNAVAAEWQLHNLMLGAKDQVTAQFGRDSNEVQAVKIKKTSERKAPGRKPKNGGGDK